jgi:pilus assembly protein Flp/PilA
LQEPRIENGWGFAAIAELRMGDEELEMRLFDVLRDFCRAESGQDLVEYALMAAVIAMGCAAAMRGVATGISGVFTKVDGLLT